MSSSPPRDAAPPDGSGTGDGSTRVTVLLVSPNADERLLYRALLEHLGLTMIETESAYGLCARASEVGADVVVLDLADAVSSDGAAHTAHDATPRATRALKADARTRGIPVLVLTGHVHDAFRRHALDAGADAFELKPIEPRAFAASVAALLVDDRRGSVEQAVAALRDH